jgi:hypothetical protein
MLPIQSATCIRSPRSVSRPPSSFPLCLSYRIIPSLDLTNAPPQGQGPQDEPNPVTATNSWWGASLIEMVNNGSVPEARVDDMVRFVSLCDYTARRSSWTFLSCWTFVLCPPRRTSLLPSTFVCGAVWRWTRAIVVGVEGGWRGVRRGVASVPLEDEAPRSSRAHHLVVPLLVVLFPFLDSDSMSRVPLLTPPSLSQVTRTFAAWYKMGQDQGYPDVSFSQLTEATFLNGVLVNEHIK